MGGVHLKGTMHTKFSHFHHVYMRWAFFPLSLVLLFPLFSTTVVLRESLSVTAEKGKPTWKCCCAFPPRSPPPPLLLSSSLLSSLFLLRQAVSSTSYDRTDRTACLHVLLILQMWESIKNACCLAAEGKTAYAIQRDKESKRACQEKREKLYSSKHFAGKEKERERERERGRMRTRLPRLACSTVNVSEKLHTGVPGPRLVAPPSS